MWAWRRHLDPVVALMVAAVVGVSAGVFALAFTINDGPSQRPAVQSSVHRMEPRPAAALDAAAVPVAPASSAAPRPTSTPGHTNANPGCPSGYVALTFDDGPSPTYTNPLLDYLTSAKVPATFFVQGSRVQADPQPTQRAAVLGFTIGNHTWNHPRLTDLPADQITAQLEQTAQVLKALGIQTGTLMRSPYGADTPAIVGLIRSLGMVPVGWTDDSRDYADGTPQVIAQRVLAGLKPHIFNQVLVHDGIDQAQPDGRIASAQTLPAIPLIVDGARAAGYCFTEFGIDGHPMIPAPTWTARGWVATTRHR